MASPRSTRRNPIGPLAPQLQEHSLAKIRKAEAAKAKQKQQQQQQPPAQASTPAAAPVLSSAPATAQQQQQQPATASTPAAAPVLSSAPASSQLPAPPPPPPPAAPPAPITPAPPALAISTTPTIPAGGIPGILLPRLNYPRLPPGDGIPDYYLLPNRASFGQGSDSEISSRVPSLPSSAASSPSSSVGARFGSSSGARSDLNSGVVSSSSSSSSSSSGFRVGSSAGSSSGTSSRSSSSSSSGSSASSHLPQLDHVCGPADGPPFYPYRELSRPCVIYVGLRAHNDSRLWGLVGVCRMLIYRFLIYPIWMYALPTLVFGGMHLFCRAHFALPATDVATDAAVFAWCALNFLGLFDIARAIWWTYRNPHFLGYRDRWHPYAVDALAMPSLQFLIPLLVWAAWPTAAAAAVGRSVFDQTMVGIVWTGIVSVLGGVMDIWSMWRWDIRRPGQPVGYPPSRFMLVVGFVMAVLASFSEVVKGWRFEADS